MSEIRIKSACLHGVEVIPVEVQVYLSGGLPGINIVGMPDIAVLESRSRVRCALKAAGYEIPRCQITVNLAPSSLKKSGTGFDLPIAMAILAATNQIPQFDYPKYLVLGELGLTGNVSAPRGSLAYMAYAKEKNLCYCSAFSEKEAGFLKLKTSQLQHIASLKERISILPIEQNDRLDSYVKRVDMLDFKDVADQEMAKRAITIAAAGKHGLLMIGPPGSGKTMLAKRIPTILPELSRKNRVEAALIHSVAGLNPEQILRGVPPFAAPHHSSSAAGLIGGGNLVLPGQISLAHHGVLFLDELAEFSSSTLQVLRQPLEAGKIQLVRASGTYTFPSDFQLVAATNPCPCGFLGDPDHICSCSGASVQRYQSKVGGPIMDRIDLVVDVMRPKIKDVLESKGGMSSKEMKDTVQEAQDFRNWRRGKRERAQSDSMLSVYNYTAEAAKELERCGNGLRLGGRAVARLARVARTIADLNKNYKVEKDDLLQATMFRSRESLGVAA